MSLFLSRTLVVCTSVFICIAAGLKHQDSVNWHKGSKLQWDDYEGISDMGSPYIANTTWAISGEGFYTKDSVTFSIQCSFKALLSWVKMDKATEVILNHEQCHFDIAEVYARKLRKSLSTKELKSSTVRADFSKLHEELVEACKKEQLRYDEETNWSGNILKQKEWQKVVAAKLDSLDDYSNTLLILRFDN